MRPHLRVHAPINAMRLIFMVVLAEEEEAEEDGLTDLVAAVVE